MLYTHIITSVFKDYVMLYGLECRDYLFFDEKTNDGLCWLEERTEK